MNTIYFWLGDLYKGVGFDIKTDKVDGELIIFREQFERLQVHDVLVTFTIERQAVLFGEGEFYVVLGQTGKWKSESCISLSVGNVEIRDFKQ